MTNDEVSLLIQEIVRGPDGDDEFCLLNYEPSIRINSSSTRNKRCGLICNKPTYSPTKLH